MGIITKLKGYWKMKKALRGMTIHTVDLKELADQIKDICKKSNCTYNYLSSGIARIDTDGDWNKALDFIEKFKAKYGSQYGTVVDRMWDTNDSEIAGCLYSNNLDKIFNMQFNGNLLAGYDLPKYYGDYKYLTNVVKHVYMSVCDKLGLENSDGELNKALKAGHNRNFFSVKLYFDTVDTAYDFITVWRDTLHKDFEDHEVCNILADMFQDTYEESDKEVIITGWVSLGYEGDED